MGSPTPHTVRLDTNTSAALKLLADAEGITISELLRRAAVARAKQNVRLLRVCVRCGKTNCDHPAGPPIGELLREDTVLMVGDVDVAALFRAGWRFAHAVR